MGSRRVGLSALLCFFVLAAAWGCGSDDKGSPAASPCPADDPATPENEHECKEAASLAAGNEAVHKRKCTDCHGRDMSGSTTALAGFPKTVLGEEVELFPPNLTSDPATGVAAPDQGGKWTDDALALAIRTGVDNLSQALCPQMQHFGDMSDFEAYSIVMYLRSIPKVNKKVPRSVCPPTKTKDQQNANP